jgi:hypothetical protein
MQFHHFYFISWSRIREHTDQHLDSAAPIETPNQLTFKRLAEKGIECCSDAFSLFSVA